MLTTEERARRWADRNRALARLRIAQPVRRRIVASVTRDGRAGYELRCGHWVPRVFGAFEYADCGDCGRERAKRAGVA